MDDRSSVQRVTVASSSVASVGYAADDQVLEVEFLSGTVYRYFDVPIEIFASFLAADSKGLYFVRSVKGRYGYARA